MCIRDSVGPFQNIAAQVVDTGADGHAGHQADAAEKADFPFKVSLRSFWLSLLHIHTPFFFADSPARDP